jgi:hypothetical protein
MGYSTTPKYRIEYTTVGGSITAGAWRARKSGPFPGYGNPTNENLRRHVEVLQKSFEKDGANAHIGASFPALRIVGACIVDQFNDEVKATYKAEKAS